jgi:amidase
LDSAALNAFLPGPQPAIAGRSDGPLHGLRFAAKDLFDIAGFVTGAGNPDWARTHGPAAAHAAAVAQLLYAGADLVGKTHTDELAFSLNGENAHYGTPINPRAPGRVPGGSSSGSASAVAGGAVEAALGTDTGGSVRIPASYCGLYGMRPTHGAIPMAGLVPLAPSFDTVGWFARDAGTLARVGRALLPSATPPAIDRLVVMTDALALADAAVQAALAPAIDLLRDRLSTTTGELAPADSGVAGGLPGWLPVFRTIQGREAWAAHGAWIEATEPAFGPGIRDRFRLASTITVDAVREAEAVRLTIRTWLERLLPPGTALLLPTAPGIAPRLATPPVELDAFRNRALALCCAAGLGGLPQISIPAGVVDGYPVGLSLIAGHRADRALLDFVEALNWPARP